MIFPTTTEPRPSPPCEHALPLPVHRAFAAFAQRRPDATALVEEGGRRWSYGELSGWAAEMAARLRENGARPGRTVALRMPRSARLVASLLAVFETGAAAVVLDPRTPAERLTAIETDAGCSAVLVPAGAPAGPLSLPVPGQPETPRARLSADGPDGERDRIACVFYTSGSTGRPKGVQVTHRNLGRFAADPYWDGPGHRVTALVSALGFDALSYDLWAPLTRGGTVVVPAEDRIDAHRLAVLISAHGVTGVFLTAAWFSQIAADAPDTLRGLRTVLTGGEAADPRAFARVRAACPRLELGHVYGPTECTTFTTRYLLAPGEPVGPGRVPIGGALPGVAVRLLGPDLAEVPAGEPGEVYVAGEQVALGYLNRPAPTAERFVADPYGPPGTRMYRTGDLAVRRPDGALEYLRRDDDQVKIRGHRVEPGEVRAALAALPGVARAAVVVRDGRLIGYAVPEHGHAVDAEELRARLAGRLPDYLVPSAVVLLDALPLTVNGKVDREALPAPAASRAGAGVPVTPAEKTLCAAFAELLGLPAVGTEDDFFVLGGDSIVAMRLVSRVRRENVTISSQDVFRLRTPGALAAAARAAAPAADLLHRSATGPLDLPPIALWLREQGEGTAEFVQSMLVETPPGLEGRALVTALRTVLDRHDALRTRLPDPSPKAVWRPEVLPPGEVDAARLLTTVDLRTAPDGPSAADVRAEVGRAMRALDPAAGELMRAVWWDRGPERPGRLLLAVHHLVIDGVSWQVLLPDLARAAEDPRALGAWGSSTPYRQWVRQHNARATHPDVLATLPHWRAASRPAPTPWPAGGPSDAASDTIATSRTMESVLPPEVGRALLTSAPAHFGATPQELLLTALAVASARRGGTRVLVLDTEGHGRDAAGPAADASADASATVGWFTCMFPVRLECPESAARPAADPAAEEAALTDAVREIRRQWRRLPEDRSSYGLLRHLHPQAAGLLAAAPARPLLFNYLGRYGAPGRDPWPYAAEAPVLGIHRAARQPLSHPLEINAVVDERSGEPLLTAVWRWSARLVDGRDVAGLAREWAGVLAEFARAASATPRKKTGRAALPAPRAAECWPCSPLQEGLLYHAHRADGTSDPYHVQTVLDLDGPVDTGALRAALATLTAQHPALRAGFRWNGQGQAVQNVPAVVEVPLREADLSRLPRDERERAADEEARRDRDEPFDPASPPLLRAVLLRLEAARSRLLLSYHHILMDGWSMQVALADLAELYGAAASGAAPVPARRPSALAYLRHVAEQDAESAGKTWQELLDGVTEPTLLTSPVPGEGGRPRTVTLELPPRRTAALRARARERGLSLNTVILGAWGLVLAQLTGRADVVFGTVVADRPPHLPDVESMVGLMNNAVPVRVNTTATAPTGDLGGLLAALQEQRTAMMPHQHLGLARITQATGLRELFDTVAVLETYTDAFATRWGPDLRVASSRVENGTHYPLCLLVSPGERITVRVQYRPGRLTEDGARDVGTRLLEALDALAADLSLPSARPIGTVPTATRPPAAEHGRHPAAVPVLERFAARVRAAPGRAAVVDTAGTLDYQSLDLASERLAGELADRGVGPEDVVALCLRRGRDAVAAMLAVLKAGAAYLWLDPRHPARRVAALAAEGRPKLLLWQTEFADALALVPAGTARMALEPRHVFPEPLPGPRRRPRPPRLPGHPAYVVHTSGTQGVPKAVVMPGAALDRLVDWHERRLPAGPGAVTAQFTSMAFDVATQEVLTALCTGRTLAVPDADTRADAAAWTAWLRAHRVTELFAPTPVLAALCEFADGERESLPDLRHLVQAGEALVVGPRLRALCARDGKRLHNHYGPAETHVATAGEVPGEPADWPARPGIGRPVPGTRVMLLDVGLCPVPDGLTGELYLAGDQLARGYLGRPGLTSVRFVADPYGPPGSRMYRTGDLARRLPDGTFEFTGRNDDQVKIRGHRIEPDEVRAALAALPGVVQAAVVARPDGRGGKELTGYAAGSAATGTPLDGPALREELARVLPDFMLPARILVLDAMPLTVNGKVDRRALPEPAHRPAGVREPRTPAERVVADAFAEVLGLDRVSVDDDFFALGGHSLLAARLLQRLRERLNPAATLARVMERATPMALAAALGPEPEAAPDDAGAAPATPTV
ncbi:non-ribosomal peptide synthetase [Streptomyces huiliensis]|uniref:non-ribosomal peptide synthetase n=1 Tax=Streptomyces huiliensis TaxID=2876027 RepID=UPI001CBD1575|nr:non-ribosomal peptide synthetase [Streptomyces huiliensis]MBZ4321610.1 amino acid adenylation domain-containing protein [Streptomyces huiliensis]